MKSFDRALNRIVARRLAELGFERRHQTWNRRRGQRVEVIRFQQSSGNTSLGCRFTVNLGTRSPSQPDAWVKAVECRDVKRIGFLRPEQLDHWYRYDPNDQAGTDDRVREALADIEAYGLAFLEEGEAPAAGEAEPPRGGPPAPTVFDRLLGFWRGRPQEKG